MCRALTEEEDGGDLVLATLSKGDKREEMTVGGALAMDMEWQAIRGGPGGPSSSTLSPLPDRDRSLGLSFIQMKLSF